ncbi:protein rolling stone-like [Vanessa tameamea]|uniref:Protein rolling stone-like n=1 Tax=Vanessa tameamea TaxID=334116 RepID=A0A8B8IL87_VANTA|nr:protein rolling stone-like [Vanessa tameamea]
MGAIKSYFKQQFQFRKFGLNYESETDFYVSCFQKNISPLPLLCVRGLIFLTCIGIILSSFILTTMYVSAATWPIYMTHWGLVLITLSSGFGFGVSATVYYNGPIDSSFGLPWYIKVYWVLYSISIPIAFFITVFYWIFLANENAEFAATVVLDIFIHAINSVLMLLLFLTARQPTNLLHFYLPFFFAVVYAIFTAIYYVAGGTDPFGNNFIYPVLDWAEPGTAMIMIALSAFLILVLHFFIAMLTICRDAFGRFCRQDNDGFRLSAY